VKGDIFFIRKLWEKYTKFIMNTSFFKKNPVPMLKEDFSELFYSIEKLEKEGVDLKSFFAEEKNRIKYLKKVKIIDINEAGIKFLESEIEEEYQGHFFNERIIKHLKSVGEDKLNFIIEKKQYFTTESIIQTKTGEDRNVIISLILDENSKENYSNVLFSIVNITAQKLVESEINLLKVDWKCIFDAVPEMIVVLDKDYNILDVNDSVLTILNKSRKFCINKKCYNIFHNLDSSPDYCLLKKVIETKRICNVEYYTDNIIREDGSSSPDIYSLSAHPLYDKDGEITRIVHISHNVTENRLSERKLRKTLQDLKEKNEDLLSFAYVASHDLQAPLRKIIAFNSLIKENCYGKISDETNNYFDRMTSSAERMRKLINDLLEYSKISTKSNTFDEVDLNKVVKEVVENIMDDKIKEVDVQINYELLPIIKCDRSQILQLFQNILSNSIKFRSKERKLVVGIFFAFSEDNKVCTLSISDNGIGFDMKYKDTIFNTFTKLHGIDEFPGSGIGLAICKRIVKRHKWEIFVESVIDDYTVFKIVIPMEKKGI